MTRASVLAAGRRAAEAGMVDACTITRLVSSSTDKVTGVVVPTSTTSVYSGRCRIQQSSPSSNASGVNAGEAYRLVVRLELQLPAAVTGVAAEDLVTVTSAAHDPDLVGRAFRVHALAHKTELTARRIGIEEITS